MVKVKVMLDAVQRKGIAKSFPDLDKSFPLSLL
jgi:hypothetical protein